MRSCFKFTAVAAAAGAEETTVLSIFEEIGFWGVQAKDFISQLSAVKSKSIQVEINSPGGDVFAGLAIYNSLKGSGKEIVVKVMGVAASAASLIAMAGDKIIMPKNTFMMVHNPWSFAMGNADELRDSADTLDKIGGSLKATYAAKTGQTEEKIAELLAKDTWLTADEAKDLGFATEVVEDVKANASFDMARADLPENVKAIFAAAKTAPVVPKAKTEDGLTDQVEVLAKAAGLEAYASVIAVAATSLEDAIARIAVAGEIVALCKIADQSKMAKPAIKSNKSVAEVRLSLQKVMAESDEDTDGTPPVKKTGASGESSGFSPTSAWKSHQANQAATQKGK